jgi:hypothetical protein
MSYQIGKRQGLTLVVGAKVSLLDHTSLAELNLAYGIDKRIRSIEQPFWIFLDIHRSCFTRDVF